MQSKKYTRLNASLNPLAAAVAICSQCLLSTGAGAQQPVLEEVLVTATKRVESLQDVPISVNTLSGERMMEAGIDRVEDLAPYVPNLSMAENGIGTAIYIRGIGSGINAGFEQSAGMYSDGIYYGRARLSRAPFLDLARVEVLRGPQPILFGKNSIASAINMITAKPTDEFEATLSALYEPSAEEMEGTAIISGPLGDSVSGRLAVRYREIGGFMENIYLGDDEADREESTIRGSLRWQPNDRLDMTLKAEIGSFDVKGRNMEIITDNPSVNPAFGGLNLSEIQTFVFGQPEAGLNTRQDYKRTSNGDESNNDTENFTLTIDYDLGEHTLTSVTGYVHYEYDENCDCDFSSASVLDVPLEEEYDQFSQEFRLTSPGGEKFDYIAGVFFQTSELDSGDIIGVPADSILVPAVNQRVPGGGDAIAFTGATRTFSQDSDLWAVFAELTWNVTDNLRLIAGGRYTVEDKEGSRTLELLNLDGTPITDPVQGATATVVFGQLFNVQVTDHDLKGKRDEDNFTPQLTAQYDLSDNTMVYATASTGFKSGGYDARGNVVPDSTSPFVRDPSKGSFEYEDEEATSFEIGSKSRFADGAAELNAALFFTTYDDLQVSIFDGTLGFLVDNAAEAEILGVELDGRLAVTDSLTLSGSMAYTDFEWKDFENGQCNFGEVQAGLCSAEGTISYEGRTNQYVADWTGTLTGDYRVPLGSTLEARATVDLIYSDEYFPSQNLDPTTVQDSYWKVNARLALSSADGKWEVALLGRNLTDEDVVTYSNPVPLSTTFGVLSHFGTVERDRNVAIQATYNF